MKLRLNQYHALGATHDTLSKAQPQSTAGRRRRGFSFSDAAPPDGSDLEELVVLRQHLHSTGKRRKGRPESNAESQGDESIDDGIALYTSDAVNLTLKVGGNGGRQGNSQSGSDSDSGTQSDSDAETLTTAELSSKSQNDARQRAAGAGMRADAAWAEAELCKLAAQSPQHAHAASRQTRVNDVTQMYLHYSAKYGVIPMRHTMSEVREDLIADFKLQTPEVVAKLAAMVLTIADQNYHLLLPILRLKLFIPRLSTQYGSAIARSRSLSRSNSLRKLRK